MIAKFADHLPLYHQESIFGRAGLAITRSTLAQWVGETDVQLQPLVDALHDMVLGQQAMHADQKSVQMLSPGSRKLTAPMSGPTPPTNLTRHRKVPGTNRERRTILAAIAGQGLDSRHGERM